jgi:hypothetical protein
MENIITAFDQVFLFNAYPAEILNIDNWFISFLHIQMFGVKDIKSNRYASK